MPRRMSTRPLYCFITFVLFCIARGFGPNEYCTIIDRNDDITTSVPLNGIQSNIDQTQCVVYYQVDLTSRSSSEKYFSFEVNFDILPTNRGLVPVLLQKDGSKPEVDETGNVDDNSTMDYNGYANSKKYHNIIIDLQNLTLPVTFYFAVYKYASDRNNYSPEPMRYDIHTQTSSNYPCQRSCSGINRGICDQQSQRCICQQGFFDVDCSVTGNVLPFEGSVSNQVPPRKWTYFYIDAKNYGGNLKLTASKNAGPVYLALLFNKPKESFVPNFFVSDGRFFLESDIQEQVLRLPQNGFKANDGGSLIIGAYNSGSNPIDLRLTISLFDQDGSARSAIMFIMIGIACGLILLWITFSILKYKAYRRQALIRQQQQAILRESLLTKQEIDKYFTVKNFDSCRSSFPQNMCSICLDEFQANTQCRQLYCEHIFHGPCIEAWFANHTNCPNCKKEMTREAVEEFLKNPNGTAATRQRATDIEEGGAGAILSPNNNNSKDILNYVSVEDERAKDKTKFEINLDSPMAKSGKQKQKEEKFKLEPVETLITPSRIQGITEIDDRELPVITGVQSENQIKENKENTGS